MKRSPVRIPLEKGGLPGYHTADLARERRQVLSKLIVSRKETYSQIIKRLNVLAIYNKNKNPELSAKIRRDIAYVQRHLSHFSKTSSKHKSPVKTNKTSNPKRKSKAKSSPGSKNPSKRKSKSKSKAKSSPRSKNPSKPKRKSKSKAKSRL